MDQISYLYSVENILNFVLYYDLPPYYIVAQKTPMLRGSSTL